MSIFHVLHQTYLRAEKEGLVDSPELDMTGRNITLLPIYHTNLRSEGYNVLQIDLDEKGVPISATFVPKDEHVVFPVTVESLNRRGKKVVAHPLCDYMPYLSNSLDKEKYASYCEQNEHWINGVLQELSTCSAQESEEAEDLKVFLQEIRKMVLNRDLLELVKELIGNKYKVLAQNNVKTEDEATIEIELKAATKSSKAKTKEIKLSDVFITFGKKFTDSKKQDINITKNKLLHKAHVQYIRRMHSEQSEKLDVCDVSGEKMYCTSLNRGLLGTGKIISVSNNKETHIGRFCEGAEVIRLGADTSEKIHLMLKFFLEHEDNSQRLYNNTRAIIWFSDDILNERDFSLSNPTAVALDPWDNPPEEYESKSTADPRAREWKMILRGDMPLPKENEMDFFYLMTINTISNGRISIQSTRTIPISLFVHNLQHWNETCSWEWWNYTSRKYENKTPRPWDIVRFVYGIENDDGKVDCLKDELKSLSFKRILPSVIDGMPLPKDMGRQIFSNYRNRISFRKNWPYLQYISCALLNKVRQDERKEKRLPMLEKDNQTRDYLYGRLLAVYEKAEMDAVKTGSVSGGEKSEGEKQEKDKSSRLTNVERVWSAFFQAPEKMLGTLHAKMRPYLDKLKSNNAGRYSYYNRLIGEIQTEIRDAESYLANKNKALNEDAVFGYYAQNREFYKSNTEKKENENA